MRFINLIDNLKNYIFCQNNKISIFYVTEAANWVIRWEGEKILETLKEKYKIKGYLTTTVFYLKNKIIHFGSRYLYLMGDYKNLSKKNELVFTWYHGSLKDTSAINLEMIKKVGKASRRARFIHTASYKAAEELASYGVDRKKIVVIPIGIDTKNFYLFDRDRKREIRKKLGIPESSICIGSFQKDGEGWREGNMPKIIKGPDIFCDVIIKLAKKYPIYVLLTGPARGYVKRRLNKAGVKFSHIYFRKYSDMVNCYNALDFYLITSRCEGGPKSLLESFACGVPVIATAVGMVKDVINKYSNYLVVENDKDPQEEIYTKIVRLIKDDNLRREIINYNLTLPPFYDWSVIIDDYYNKIYNPLLSELC